MSVSEKRQSPISYHEQAEKAEELARRARSDAERKALEETAALWRGLAERRRKKCSI
jgi:hypothetical protein